MVKNTKVKKATVKNGKPKSFYSILGKIGDIIFIPIMIIAFLSCIFMLSQRSKNRVVSIFGMSLVTVLSGSMVDAGFNIGDSVLTHKVTVKNIKEGDIIAFYYYSDPADVLTKYDIESHELPEVLTPVNNRLSKNDVAEKDAKIYFHYVVDIRIDDSGAIFYQTKGINNDTADMTLTRSDFVVGEYVYTPMFIRNIISFCGSSIGMIILVCGPLSILVLIQCLSLIEQLGIMSVEKKLLARKCNFKDSDIQQDFNGNDMELYNKIYLYYLTPNIDKEAVKEFMWGNLLSSNKLSKAEEKELSLLNKSLIQSDDANAYFDIWIEGSKGYNRKKLIKYKQEVMLQEVFKKM